MPILATDDPLLKHVAAVREHFSSVAAIKTALAVDDYETAAEAWRELDEATQYALWLASSKGGIFSTVERDKMKSTEFREAGFR